MASPLFFSEIPIINVTAENIKELWPSLVLAMKTATFVAVDTELSGLGNRKLLGARSLPDRYKNLCEVAKTRSILSLGLSCFKLQKVGSACLDQDFTKNGTGETPVQIKEWAFSVQTFNILLLCSEDFMVEPGALKFLVEHGFDFNKQYSAGVSYCPGMEKTDTKDKQLSSKSGSGPTARQLFDILLWCEVPVVLHNGFVDLVFLYQNLYAELPSSLQVFLADLAEMFPQGILDTKFAVEFVDRLPATYLEYVFRKWQRKNALQVNIERRMVSLDFGRLSVNSAHVTYCHCGLPSSCVEMDFIPKATVLQDLVCHSFAGHGWCTRGKQCPKSHAIDLILDLDGIKAAKSRKRRRRQREMQMNNEENVDQNSTDELELSSNADNCKKIRLGDSSAAEDSEHCSGESAVFATRLAEDDSITDTADNPQDAGESVTTDNPQDAGESVTNQQETDPDSIDYDVITEAYLKSSFQLEEARSGGHRAGFDAFMTGFIMACLLSKHTTIGSASERVVGAGIKFCQLAGVGTLNNKIYAMGKDQPLIVSKSNFCTTSKNHKERMQQLRKA